MSEATDARTDEFRTPLEKTSVRMLPAVMDDLRELVERGRFLNDSEAIRHAVTDYTESEEVRRWLDGR